MTVIPHRYCADCFYPLDGLRDARCPECGRPYDPSDPASFVEIAGTPTKIYVTPEASEADLLRLALHRAGIHAVVMGSGLAASTGIGTPAMGITLWVGADHATRAAELIAETIADRGSAPPGTPWTCPACAEPVDGDFDLCWNCQTERPSAPADGTGEPHDA